MDAGGVRLGPGGALPFGLAPGLGLPGLGLPSAVGLTAGVSIGSSVTDGLGNVPEIAPPLPNRSGYRNTIANATTMSGTQMRETRSSM